MVYGSCTCFHRFVHHLFLFFLFFFNDTATTEIYTLSLHDALPISARCIKGPARPRSRPWSTAASTACGPWSSDRKSTRLNSSHVEISYAVFCLKKKKHTKSCRQPAAYRPQPCSCSAPALCSVTPMH